jgi:hypothetical protein
MTGSERDRRSAAATRYRPDRVRCLLIAEAPPAALDRYFYFEDVREQDSLFRHVAEGVLGHQPDRAGKATALAALRDLGYFLIDVSEDPVRSGSDVSACIPGLVERASALDPDKVILIKANVFDLAYAPLVAAGLPVVRVRMPFPGSGRQREFVTAFAEALRC